MFLELTQILVNTLFGQYSRAAVLPYRTQSPATTGLRWEMAAIPVTLGSRSRICVQPSRRRPCSLAAALDRNQESTVNVRYFRDTKVVRGMRDRL